ncbi:MAG: C40 family peptidase [Campylobacterales bacterium]|nr:C40 family peptidase [Campylobacterales bacterium]
MSDRFIITFGDYKGLKQYSLPLFVKKIPFIIFSVFVFLSLVLYYYMHSFHEKTSVLDETKKELQLRSTRLEEIKKQKEELDKNMDAQIDMKVQNIKAEYDSTIKKKENVINFLKTEVKQKEDKSKKEINDLKNKIRKLEQAIALRNMKFKKMKGIAEKQLGKRYVWGAVGPGQFDCSGFTSYVCRQYGINIPRTSFYQSKYGKPVNRDNLKKGDLIFFDTSKERKGKVNHVGIYIGENKFIHASSSKKKVVVSQLNGTFYGKRFIIARRVLK